MTTLQIELDEAIAAKMREAARIAGKTPEVLAAEILTEQTVGAAGRDALRRFLESAKNSTTETAAWKWNREELYDR